MSVIEENPQETPPPVEEKVKKERSLLQKECLEKARVKGLEVRLAKAADRKEAKEQALLQVAEKYRTKPAVVEVEKSEPEIEPEPEPEIETEVQGQAKSAELATEKFQDPSELKPEPEPEPEKFEPPPPPPEPVAPPEPLYVFKNKRLTYNI